MKRRDFLNSIVTTVLCGKFLPNYGFKSDIETAPSITSTDTGDAARPSSGNASHSAWAVSSENKPWIWWWWLGSAVDEANISRQLVEFAEAGIGGVQITAIYGVQGYESRYIDFLSPKWMEMLEFTCREAKRLGVGVDMSTGTGWPFGGPWVTEDDARKSLSYSDGQLGGKVVEAKVKRFAPGGDGRVVDPYSAEALKNYLRRFSDAFARFPHGLIRSQFHDSFEYYGANWTAKLPEVFKQLHGYDIQQFAAELSGTTPMEAETLGRIKSDYRQTLAKLHLDYITEWTRWSHGRQNKTCNQAHGAPGNLLDLYGAVDIPETEVYGSTPFPIPGFRREESDVKQALPNPLVYRMASSAAHVMGRRLVASETFTWLREHWKEALSFTKPEVDQLFAAGINHVFYTGAAYSPQDATWPGWLFYVATEFNSRNPWWENAFALNRYIGRVQSVLQSGRPDNDVLLYWPFFDLIDEPNGLERTFTVHDDRWLSGSAFGQIAEKLTSQGYSYDYISDAQLLTTRFEKGAIATLGGCYKVLLVPATRRMPVETLEQLATLIRNGATVIFEALPEDLTGYGRLDERRARFKTFLEILQLRRAVVSADVLSALKSLRVRREPIGDLGVSFIRRAQDKGHDYFFANLTAKSVEDWVTLGTVSQSAMLLDPLSGLIGVASMRSTDSGKPEVYLQLAPGESLLLRTFDRMSKPPGREKWPYLTSGSASVPLNGNWSIEFVRGGPELPPTLRTTVLKSWTELSGDQAKRFAGTARYRLEFDFPEQPADEWVLNLGDVRESARVRLNGVEIGIVWSLPFTLRVGSKLKRVGNVLEVDVSNLAANRIRDMDRRGVKWKIMRNVNYVNVKSQAFDASQWELTPSGLLGPITLTPMLRVRPK